jgi:hypothetical protein
MDRLHERIAGRFARAEPRARGAQVCGGPGAEGRVDAGARADVVESGTMYLATTPFYASATFWTVAA